MRKIELKDAIPFNQRELLIDILRNAPLSQRNELMPYTIGEVRDSPAIIASWKRVLRSRWRKANTLTSNRG